MVNISNSKLVSYHVDFRHSLDHHVVFSGGVGEVFILFVVVFDLI